MTIEKQPAFPRRFHGIVLIIVGLAIAVMGPFGWLGGIHGGEGDLVTAVYFFFGGGCVALLGLWLAIRGARDARRGS